MSTFKVEIVKIESISNHPNADRLEILKINDWNCVSAKGNFKSGDLCLYFPIDSVLPEEIEVKIFGPNSKVRLNNHRVRTIKLRGAISQGLAVPPSLFFDKFKEGQDVTEKLGITKYEPPVDIRPVGTKLCQATKKQINPNFRKYTGIENAKNYTNIFEDGEIVSVTEKIHGTNFRCGWVKNEANSFWKKILKFIKILPEYEFVYGSHNVQLQNKLLAKTYYNTNVYSEAVHKYDLKKIIPKGTVVYGEIYGDGIQKGYTYGCKQGERKLVIFDIMINDKYVDVYEFEAILSFWKPICPMELKSPPEIYCGPFNKEKIKELTNGNSILCPTQKVREGVVVKPLENATCIIGRKMLKFISDEYLLRNQNEESIAH